MAAVHTGEHAVVSGASAQSLALQALDRWINDLSDDNHGLRAQLREARKDLETTS
jgi:hypothetical protein